MRGKDQGKNKKPETIAKEKQITKADILAKVNEDIAVCVVDFLNLMFGNSKESSIFWEQVLAPQIEHDFDLNVQEVNLKDIPLGGLFHAVVYQCGIDLKLSIDAVPKEFASQKQAEIDTLIKELGTVPKPFKRSLYNGMKVCSKTFKLRNLDLRMLGERYREFRENKNHDLSLKACNIKLSIEKMTSYRKESAGEPTIFADLGETLLEMGEVDKAIERANFGLKVSAALHAERVKCYCVLIRGLAMKNQMEKALEYFDEALKVLEFHLGPYHPLHSTVYSVLGHFYAERKLYQDALFLYKSSLVCCIRILGPNHTHTGEVYMDLANLMLRMGQREEALNNFEKAYLVFEASKGPECADCAATSYQMANIQLGFGNIALIFFFSWLT